jgi:ribosomal protein L37AE/L43A
VEITEPETKSEEPETFQEKPEKTPETPPETQEEGITANRINQALKLRVSGKNFKQISGETGLSPATLSRILKDVELKNKSEVDQEPDKSQILESIFPETEPQIPRGFTLAPSLTSAQWSELSKLSKNQLIALAGEYKASLQSQALSRRGNGDSQHYPSDGSASAESAFWIEMAKTERVERALRIRDRYSDKKGEYPADVKSLLELFRFLTPKQANELEIYLAGRQDEQKNLQTAVRTAETNMLDIKLEELRQNAEMDNRKIDWEIEKWKVDKTEDNRKWELVSRALEGPIGQAIQSVGTAGAERIAHRKQPKIAQIACPNCQKSVYIDENAKIVVCGACGAHLSKQVSESKPMPIVPPEAFVAPEENAEVEEESHSSEVREK